VRVLNDAKDQGALDVQVLLKMLQITIKFEEELERYYSKASLVQMVYEGDPDIFDESSAPDPNSYDAIRKKFKEQKQREEREKQEADILKEQAVAEAEGKKKKQLQDEQQLVFKGIISKAFAAFMNQYIDLERSNLEALLEKINKEEIWYVNETLPASERKEEPRLASSDNLFSYVQKSLKRCSKLDTRKLLFDITQEYRRGLLKYADLLRSKLPKTENPSLIRTSDLKLICRIVNTCEYCIDTLPAMKENIVAVM
jgi:hypothetical protein